MKIRTRPLLVAVAVLGASLGVAGTVAAYAPKKGAKPTAPSPKVDLAKPVGDKVSLSLANDLHLPEGTQIEPLPNNLPKGFTGRRVGVFKGVETDRNGVIITVGVKSYSQEFWVDGCGAKLTDLPQLMMAHGIERGQTFDVDVSVTLGVKNGCLDSVRAVRRSWGY